MQQKYLEDLKCLYEALRKHPSFLFQECAEAFEELYKKVTESIVDYNSLLNAMTKLTMFFKDGHTNIEIPYTNQDGCLKISCQWQNDRLFLNDNYMDIRVGTEIIAVENMGIDELIRAAAEVIPHENVYLVKSRMIEYPYMNYHIFSKMNLIKLFGNKDFYEITFKFNNKNTVRRCVLEKYDGFLNFKENICAYYEIQGNKAVLHLNECICDEHYRVTLNDLAVQCNERNIELLEVDLSENMGGSSAVIDEFIKYVNVDSFRRYEMVDCSSGTKRVVYRRSDKIANQKEELLFPDKIICRISNTTFSSARTFAVTLKDNGIATIVGQPSGGKPSSYGMPCRMKTPNCNIRFRISRCLFLRPDDRLDNEEALYPDSEELL